MCGRSSFIRHSPLLWLREMPSSVSACGCQTLAQPTIDASRNYLPTTFRLPWSPLVTWLQLFLELFCGVVHSYLHHEVQIYYILWSRVRPRQMKPNAGYHIACSCVCCSIAVGPESDHGHLHCLLRSVGLAMGDFCGSCIPAVDDGAST